MKARLLATAVVVSIAGVLTTATGAGAVGSPTCSDTLGIVVHGQHIIGDYVTGVGRANLTWPPAGEVGDAVAGNNGPAVRGGPGPGFHFSEGFAPGASFCNDSQGINGFDHQHAEEHSAVSPAP
jgi:hypothetical protein